MIQGVALTGILLVLTVLAPWIYSSRIKGLMKLFLVRVWQQYFFFFLNAAPTFHFLPCDPSKQNYTRKYEALKKQSLQSLIINIWRTKHDNTRLLSPDPQAPASSFSVHGSSGSRFSLLITLCTQKMQSGRWKRLLVGMCWDSQPTFPFGSSLRIVTWSKCHPEFSPPPLCPMRIFSIMSPTSSSYRKTDRQINTHHQTTPKPNKQKTKKWKKGEILWQEQPVAFETPLL